MKHLKKLNESNLSDRNLIAGYSDALVVYLDVDTDQITGEAMGEISVIAEKNNCDYHINDNAVTFIPSDDDMSVLDGVKRDLGL